MSRRSAGGAILRSRPVIVTISVAILATVWMAWLYVAGEAKIAPGLLSGGDRKRIVVELRFPPEKFHMLQLQELGRIQTVEGRTIHLLDVPSRRIREFARHYWVASIGFSPGSER